jgi:antitoxin component of RelBE/YafQ-DinJ toxin-antitoxin module
VVKRNGRVTSVQMRPEDDAALSAVMAKLGGKPSDAIRYALHRAAEADGLAVDTTVKEATA